MALKRFGQRGALKADDAARQLSLTKLVAGFSAWRGLIYDGSSWREILYHGIYRPKRKPDAYWPKFDNNGRRFHIFKYRAWAITKLRAISSRRKKYLDANIWPNRMRPFQNGNIAEAAIMLSARLKCAVASFFVRLIAAHHLLFDYYWREGILIRGASIMSRRIAITQQNIEPPSREMALGKLTRG